MPLPRAQRVRRTRDFAAVRATGSTQSGRHLLIAILETEGAQARFGFTVTKKLGCAVVRNKVRRRLAGIAAEFAPAILKAALIITIPRYPAVKAEFPVLRAEWEKLARRAGLLPPRVP
jgi:ribonuclease P protein component